MIEDNLQAKINKLILTLKRVIDESDDIQSILTEIDSEDTKLMLDIGCMVHIFEDEDQLEFNITNEDKEFLSEIGAIW